MYQVPVWVLAWHGLGLVPLVYPGDAALFEHPRDWISSRIAAGSRSYGTSSILRVGSVAVILAEDPWPAVRSQKRTLIANLVLAMMSRS